MLRLQDVWDSGEDANEYLAFYIMTSGFNFAINRLLFQQLITFGVSLLREPAKCQYVQYVFDFFLKLLDYIEMKKKSLQ